MRVAIVHDWLTGMRGGEKVLEVFCELYPQADLYTLVHIPGKLSKIITERKIHTSFLNSLPFAWRRHQIYLPFFPMAIESFDFSSYDLVLSSSHCVAKGAITPAQTLHICYCHTPMRYAWDFHGIYRAAARSRWLVGPMFSAALSYLRMWDVASARRPNHYIANSHHVRKRIERYYGQQAAVIHPPVDTEQYKPSSGAPDEYWLLLSALVPYKGLDIAIEAFNQSGRPLHVVGAGAERARLEAKASGNIRFFGWLSDEEVHSQYCQAQGLVFPGEEDFGITPLEANACGRPVVAFRRGGVLESQQEGTTACFFDQQTAESLNGAIDRASRQSWDEDVIRTHALSFDRKRFKKQMEAAITRCHEAWQRWLADEGA